MSDLEYIRALEEKLQRAVRQLRDLDAMNVQKLIEGRGVDQAQKTRGKIATIIRDLEG